MSRSGRTAYTRPLDCSRSPVCRFGRLQYSMHLKSCSAGLRASLRWPEKINQPPCPLKDALSPDHYGLLVFLLSKRFADEEQAVAALGSSTIFRIAPERTNALLNQLRRQGLVVGALPTTEATELVMQSPYALYVGALREVTP